MEGSERTNRHRSVCSRPTAGAEQRWGDGVGESILEVDRHIQGATGDRILSTWRAASTPARILTVLAAAACVVVGWESPATGVSLLVLVGAALVDAVERRLPNALVAGAALPVLIALAGSPELVRSAALGALVVAGPLLVTHLVTPSGMGFGDVKAGAVLGAAMGLIDVEVAVLALVLGLGAGAAWGLVRRARTIALGPALVAGGLLAALIGATA